jgi:hypothetical protein
MADYQDCVSCPVCLSPEIREAHICNGCGNVFCKLCLSKALSVVSNCPVCRCEILSMKSDKITKISWFALTKIGLGFIMSLI